MRAVQELASRVASTRPESTLPVMDEVIIIGRRMSPAQQQAFEMREALAQLLQSALDEHRAEQTLRNQAAVGMGFFETAWVSWGGIANNAYQGAKEGVQGLWGGAVSAFEFNQRAFGAALHVDFEEYFAEYGRAFDWAGDKAEAAAAGVQNLATVLADDEAREMLTDFVAEYYNSGSGVTRTELLGVLPAELLIAAATAGAGTVVKGAGTTQRIGAAIGDLANALRKVEIEFVDIDARGPGAPQAGAIGLRVKGVQDPFVRVGDDLLFVNKAGTFYPDVPDLRTGRSIQFPIADLQRVDVGQRVDWGAKQRGEFIQQWYQRGYETPRGGWAEYDIHHITPREFGGTNDFWNLAPIPRQTHPDFNDFWMHY